MRGGWRIADAYLDAAVAGDSVILCPGIKALLEDARRGAFEIVVAEALDPVSRNLANVALRYKHLRVASVMIVTLDAAAARTLLAVARTLPSPEEEGASLGFRHVERRRIQFGLREEGLEPEPPDGKFTPGTRAAIRAWQRKSGRTATGFLTGDQADAILAQTPPSALLQPRCAELPGQYLGEHHANAGWKSRTGPAATCGARTTTRTKSPSGRVNAQMELLTDTGCIRCPPGANTLPLRGRGRWLAARQTGTG